MPEPVSYERTDPPDPGDLGSDSGPESGERSRSASGSGPELAPDLRAKLPQRDRAALEHFYAMYFDRIYGYVRRMLGEDQLAEDVTQDVFMHAQRSIHTYDPARAPGPWVFMIATNKVRDFWRSRRHKDVQVEASLDDEEQHFQPETKERGPLPELENEELASELSQAIDSLPPGMREALVLRYFEGLSFEEIAARIGRHETAVRKRYSRALGELRTALQRYAGPDRSPASEVHR